MIGHQFGTKYWNHQAPWSPCCAGFNIQWIRGANKHLHMHILHSEPFFTQLTTRMLFNQNSPPPQPSQQNLSTKFKTGPLLDVFPLPFLILRPLEVGGISNFQITEKDQQHGLSAVGEKWLKIRLQLADKWTPKHHYCHGFLRKKKNDVRTVVGSNPKQPPGI